MVLPVGAVDYDTTTTLPCCPAGHADALGQAQPEHSPGSFRRDGLVADARREFPRPCARSAHLGRGVMLRGRVWYDGAYCMGVGNAPIVQCDFLRFPRMR